MKKYSSIENTYQKKFLARPEVQAVIGDWYVTEKVHGSNASFVYDSTIKMAKRNDYFAASSNEYNHKTVLEKYRQAVENVAKLLNKTEDDTLIVFGELFGGNTCPEYPRALNASAVQKGVFYSPNNDFYAFDVMFNGTYLDVEKCNEVLEKAGFFYAKTLFKGSLEECLAYPNEFNSTISAQLGFPNVSNNVCEGVVIRPGTTSYLMNSSRIILKNKNDKWSEKTKVHREKVEKVYSDELNEVLDVLSQLVNDNRLRAVLSKIGEVTQKDFGLIAKALTTDVFEDLVKEIDLDVLSKEDKKELSSQVGRQSASLIKENFVDIVNGEF